MIEEVVVPDVGGAIDSVRVAEWLVQEGDQVVAGMPLFVLETDKATTQPFEAFRGGYLRHILAPVDAVVGIGDTIALIADSMEESPVGAASRAAPEASATKSPVAGATGAARLAAPTERILASPLAKRLAQEQGIDLARLAGSGPAGEVHKRDLPGASHPSLDLFRRMVLIRRFEDHLYRLFLQGQVPGTLHQCQGQEAVAVGVCAALRTDDVIFSTHRPVGHLIAKGASLPALTAEIWGKATGCAGGKGGQMHLQDPAVGALPSNAIVGANIPIAVGAALGFKLRGLDRVAVSFFGDGAANIGTFHEGLNLAAVKDAPVLFVCENNLYAASTPIGLATKIENVGDRAAAYGMPGQVVDGMDVLAVYRSAVAAVDRARAGGGPTLLEYKTYRYPGHSRGDPGNYRSKEELEAWRRRDPIEHCRQLLLGDCGESAARLEAVERECQAVVEDAVRFAVASPEPTEAAGLEHVYADREEQP